MQLIDATPVKISWTGITEFFERPNHRYISIIFFLVKSCQSIERKGNILGQGPVNMVGVGEYSSLALEVLKLS